MPCKWLYEPGHFTKHQVNICIELVPHNPLLTYHQHNLCLRCLTWLRQLWSILTHVPFVLLIIVFFLCTFAKSVLNVALLPFPCVLSSMSWLFYYVLLSNSLQDLNCKCHCSIWNSFLFSFYGTLGSNSLTQGIFFVFWNSKVQYNLNCACEKL